MVISMVPISCNVLDNLTDPIFVNSNDGVYTACNKAFEDLVNIPKHKILGRTIYDVWPGHLASLYSQSDSQLRQKKGEQRLKSCVTTSRKSDNICGVYYKTLIECDVYQEKNAVLGVFKADDPLQKMISDLESPLTNREIDVLTLASKGLSNKLISSSLGISIHTVADYFKSIHTKLDVHNRIEAITIARHLNLIIT